MGNSNAATSFGSGLTLNNDAVATGKLSFTLIYGNGSAAGSFRWTTSTPSMKTVPLGIEGTTLNAGGMSVMQFMNYSNSTTFKTILTRAGTPSDSTGAYVNLWQDTSPINKITIYPNDATNTILSGSTFSIYGIQVGQAAQKAQGGNIVASDGTYMYHAFTSSGSFIPNSALTADVLVIAGGGGAGGTYGNGGGGAGGLVYTASQSLSVSKSYTVLVGAGGAGNLGVTGATVAAIGSNSNVLGSSLSLTAAVGGGGSAGGTSITNGGSGAGGTYTDGTNSWYTGSGTAGQGNNGGQGTTVGGDKSLGGGGGGAGAAGSAASNPNAGAGGAGSSTYSSWGSATKTGQLSSGTYYYAGGGGGGTDNRISSNAAGAGGLGGGGAGGTNGGAGTAALANTGGGGGGGGYNPGGPGTAGGSGGSGIVIIRYAI
jgi:hypothetical protein